MKVTMLTSILILLVGLLGSTSAELPPGWDHTDVGTCDLPGDASYDNRVWTLKGNGSKEVWDSEDTLHFVFRPFSGDCVITARVTSVGNTHPWARSGVMIRESLAAGSKYAMMLLTPSGRTALQYRSMTGQTVNSCHTSSVNAAFPCWVKLVRRGNNFTGYYSFDDGENWVNQPCDFVVGTNPAIVDMAREIYIGLAVSSHDSNVLCEARFDHVGVAPLTRGFTYQGRLMDGNDVAEGLHDFEFTLYDALDGGTQQGSAIRMEDLDVIDGYFTVELDFGNEVFDGNDRWLEVVSGMVRGPTVLPSYTRVSG